MPRAAILSPKLCDRRDIWNAELLRWCSYDGEYEMPVLPACNTIPQRLTAFTDAKIKKADSAFIHFYEDDYKFECIWRTPNRYLPLLQAYGGAIAPDFSVYREMPLPQQVYNIYKSRAVSYWLTRNGVSVIPNVRWGDQRTYFCFDGLQKNSVLAVGTYGCVKHLDDRRCFTDGFMVMFDRLQPKAIVVYGSTSDKIFLPLFTCNAEIVHFDSDFSLSHKKVVV